MKVKVIFGLAGLVFLGLIALGVLMKVKRKEIFEYDPNLDYCYAFKNADTLNLTISNGKVILPKKTANYKTAFLKVKIKSTYLGRFFSPNIEIKSSQRFVTGYFEYGGSGNRYLNISSLLEPEENEIELKSNFLKILDQNVQLIYYSNAINADSKLLVIAPHPDDAEIAAYGLYSKYPNAFVLTLTAGENGEMSYDELYSDSLRHFLKKGQIRTINSLSVPLMAGLNQNNILNLGYHDGTIKEMHDSNPLPISSQSLKADFSSTFRELNISHLKDSLIESSTWVAMVKNLEIILKSYQPDIIVSPHPQMDSHPDHQYSTVAVIQAIKNAGINKGELFLYSNHQSRTEFFPFGKSGGTVSLPPNFDDEYYFYSIYSHHLTSVEQSDKVLALDAMNDLRPDTDWRFWHKLLKSSFDNFKIMLKGQNNSYFKRAVRSNELFFVVPISDLYDDNILKELQFGKDNISKK